MTIGTKVVALARWQPIKTAPHDGSEILAYWDQGKVMSIVAYSLSPNREGWQWADDTGYVSNPTHWMPLPDPPSTPT